MYTSKFKEKCKSYLEQGRDNLSMTMAIVSHIENEKYEIVCVSSIANVFVAGDVFPLKDTYCRDVYEKMKTIAITEIDSCPGLQRHPLYESLPLEAYISCPIIVNEVVWGTINLSCMKIRDSKFNDEEIEFVETAAKELGSLLENETT